MANKPLQSIKFPDLPDTYTIPVVDSTLAVSGAAADAKQTGDSLADKVDKVSGKGLSTEDYTTEEKTKLADVETGATKTTIDSTLTVAGNAADAKAVGDAIASEDKKALAAFVTDIASGSIAHFENGADNIPMKDVLVHIEPVQAGSGDPSPDNVRPITGWTGAQVTRAGKNLFPKSSQNSTKNGITIETVSDGVYHIYGTATVDAAFNIGNYVFPREQLELSGVTSDSNAQIYLNFKLNGTYVNRQVTVTKAKPTVRYTPEYDGYDSFDCGIFISSGRTVDEYISPMLRLASDTDATFEPYNGTTYSITFPSSAGTVYGGTLDVTSGVLTVEYQKVIFDGTQTGWVASGTGYRYYSINSFADGVFTSDKNVVCNYLENRSYTSAKPIFLQSGGAGNHNIYIYNMNLIDSSIVDVASLLAYLTENPLEITYKLATPQTYQLTPQEITSLLGENNLWADTGDSEVEYRADTKMYVDAKVAAAVSALS